VLKRAENPDADIRIDCAFDLDDVPGRTANKDKRDAPIGAQALVKTPSILNRR